MTYRVSFVAEQLRGGEFKCVSTEDASHAATWEYWIRIEEHSKVVVTRANPKAARHGYACDRHLYPCAQYEHGTIQSTHSLREGAGVRVAP